MEKTYNNRLKLTMFVFLLIPFIIASFFILAVGVKDAYKKTDQQISECADKFIDRINEYSGSTMQKIRFINYYSDINACLMKTKPTVIGNETIETNNRINDVIEAMLTNNDLSEFCIFTNNPNAVPISIIRFANNEFLNGLNLPEDNITWMLDGTDTQANLCVYKKFLLVDGYENVIRIRIPVMQLLKSFETSSFDKIWVDFELSGGNGISFGINGGKFTSAPINANSYKKDFVLSGVNGKITVSVERKYIIMRVLKFFAIYFAAGMLLFAAAFAISKFTADNITRDLNNIISTLGESGTYNIKSLNVKNKEFKIIQKYLTNLDNEIKRENDKKMKLQTEMLNLRITPHFIYNNLSAIKSTSSDKFTRLAVDKFVKYCRNIFSNRNEFIKVGDEVKNSCEYLELLQFCYDFEFDVITDIEKECENMILPANILQPILENAFIHGINRMPDDFCGVIKIEAKPDCKYLYIKVSDNAGKLGTNKSENGHHALDILRQLLDVYYKNGQCSIELYGDSSQTTAEIKVEVKYEI